MAYPQITMVTFLHVSFCGLCERTLRVLVSFFFHEISRKGRFQRLVFCREWGLALSQRYSPLFAPLFVVLEEITTFATFFIFTTTSNRFFSATVCREAPWRRPLICCLHTFVFFGNWNNQISLPSTCLHCTTQNYSVGRVFLQSDKGTRNPIRFQECMETWRSDKFTQHVCTHNVV